jgi:hypothetical protein
VKRAETRRDRIGLSATEDHFVLEVPPRGLHAAAVGQLAGGLLVLVICAQWTGRTLAAGGGTATPCMPFWLLGVGVIAAAVHGMIKHHRVDLRPEAGWIRLSPIGWKRPLRTPTLAVTLDHVTRGEADGRGGTEVPVLVLDDGLRRFRIMEGFSDADLGWVRGELGSWLAKRANGRAG